MLFFINALLLINTIYGKELQRKQLNDLTNKFEICKKEMDLYWLNLSMNHKLINNVQLINETSDSLRFSELNDNNNKLFFYYSELNCGTCIDESIEKLKIIEKKYPNFEIIIISKYQNIQDLARFKRLHKYKKNILNLVGDQSLINSMDYDLPFFFVTNSDLRIKMPFIVASPVYDKIENYFDIAFCNYLVNGRISTSR